MKKQEFFYLHTVKQIYCEDDVTYYNIITIKVNLISFRKKL